MPKQLCFVIEYAKELYSEAFIQRISNNFLHLISDVCNHPEQMLHDISCISLSEQEELRNVSKGPWVEYDRKLSLVKRMQRSVSKNPERIAISYNSQVITFAELDKLSDDLAVNLIKKVFV